MNGRVKAMVYAALLLAAACGSGGDSPAADATTRDAPGAGDASARTIVDIITTKGTMKVELFPQHMPITTSNFLAYVDSGWYDGTLIHRVIDDWVIQGGGYTSGLQSKTPNAPITLETSPMVSHVHGAISMARNPSVDDSATSQWFIVDWPSGGTPPQPGQLDGNFAAFGVLIDGFDVLAAIAPVATQSAGGLDDVPVEEIVVTAMVRRSR